MNHALIIILSFLVLLLVGVVFLFFHMKSLRGEVESAWLNLLDRLNVRLDKIPNLIETLRRLTEGQEKLFESMIDLREKSWPLDQPDKERVHAELAVAGVLHQTWELSGKYEELKKDTNFLELRTEFKDTAKEIDDLTNIYNKKARHYNKSREFLLFKPFLLVLGFKRLPILEFE